MNFKENIFLIAFLPIVLLLYYILPKKARWGVLLASSLIFYILSSGIFTFIMLGTSVTIYVAGLLMQKINDNFKKQKSIEGITKEEKKLLKKKATNRKKLVVLAIVIINFGLLLTLKYGNFFLGMVNNIFGTAIPPLSLILPLGISFYTLQAVSYVIDVYRGTCKADKNFGRVLLFVCFFPQIIEGPIGRYDKLAGQLYEGHSFDYDKFMKGLQLMLWGLIKIMVIADRAGIFVGNVFEKIYDADGSIILLGVLLYTIQLYADFSGCMDLVKGMGQLFGIEMADNFRRPFFSTSVNEFWRRWHITLGAWLRDYIFYPISLSKFFANLSAKAKKNFGDFLAKFLPSAFALFFVWFINGLWHGAEVKYIVYGLYYYVVMMLGLLFEPLFVKITNALHISRKSKPYFVFQVIRTFLLVNLGMLIFRANTLFDAWYALCAIFSKFNGDIFATSVLSYKLHIYDFVVIAIGAVALFIVGVLQERGHHLRDEIAKKNIVIRWIIYFVALFILIIVGAYGEGYRVADFLYAQF